MYTCIKIRRLRRGELILLFCCCCWWLLRSRLLGCGGPTLCRRRRLGSWPGNLQIKLIHAHNGWQAQALKALHDNGLPFVDALEHGV